MVLTGKFEITKIVYEKEGFNIYGAVPMGDIVDKVELNKYKNVTLQSTTARLQKGHIYTLSVEPRDSKYGLNYFVKETGLEFKDIDEITPKLNYDLLCELTTQRLADNIQEIYPNFVELVLTNKTDEIDTSKIYGVKEKLLNKFIDKINEHCSAFLLRANFPILNLSMTECKALLNKFDTLNQAKENLASNPYESLIKHCDRSFFNIDKLLYKNYTYNDFRIEYLIDAFIRLAEYEGSTYIDAIDLANQVMSYDANVVSMLKDIAMESNVILYNENKNILQRVVTYKQELEIAKFIKRKIKNSEIRNWDWSKFSKIKDGELTSEQQGVLKSICNSDLSLLVGFAGSGKSSAVMAVLKMLEAYNQSYTMLSPTGKAAMRLKEQTGRQAYTIHKATMGDNVINTDWIIIDEMSMVSLELLSMVISSDVNPNTKYIFVGDSAQLPSIGIGKLLGDMIESKIVPTTFLTHTFRFNEGGASYVATCSRQGQKYLENDNNITLGTKKDYSFIHWDNNINQVLDIYKSLIEKNISKNDICIISPQNIGEYGTLAINNLVQSYINPINNDKFCLSTTIDKTSVIFHANDLVMVTKNDYQAPLYGGDEDATTAIFNGQIGEIIKVNLEERELIINIEGELIVFNTDTIQNLRLAYCASCHKVQGSSFKYIIELIIPQHKHMLSRELLYTAQTRLERELYEISTKETIEYALGTRASNNRFTRLIEFLQKELD